MPIAGTADNPPKTRARLIIYLMLSAVPVCRNDGCGFDPQQQVSGFGLGGMRQRVEQIGAQLEIQIEQVSGTKVIIGHICWEHPFVKTYQNRDKAMNSFLA